MWFWWSRVQSPSIAPSLNHSPFLKRGVKQEQKIRKYPIHHLSKTRLLQGIQCPKSLYLQIHRSDLAAPPSPSQKNLFDQGYLVQKKACEYFSPGIAVCAPYWDFESAGAQTAEALEKKPPFIYEACFSSGALRVRVDILELTKTGGCNIIEVKSSAGVKKIHIQDLAVQKYVLERLGHTVEKAFVLYVNRDCVFPDLKNLFVKKDVTAEVVEVQPQIETAAEKLKNVIHQDKEPDVKIGPHCKKPYPCPFISYCWKDVPKPSVFDIPEMGESAWEYYSKNKVRLKDVPKSNLLPRQSVFRSVQLKSKPFIDKKLIRKELSKWSEPLYFLDFETISSPIPNFKGVRPFQQVPFQFSCFKQEVLLNKTPGSGLKKVQTLFKEILKARSLRETKEFSFEQMKEGHYLHSSADDPRRPLAEKLVQFMGRGGSVAAYYKDFESQRLKEMAEIFPDLKEHLLDIASRLVDPLPVLRRGVCFKEFGSSWSLKSVAPVLLGEKWSYGQMEVKDGLEAQRAFEKMAALPAGDPKKEEIKNNLINYCRQDTLCLALVIEWLYENS